MSSIFKDYCFSKDLVDTDESSISDFDSELKENSTPRTKLPNFFPEPSQSDIPTSVAIEKYLSNLLKVNSVKPSCSFWNLKEKKASHFSRGRGAFEKVKGELTNMKSLVESIYNVVISIKEQSNPHAIKKIMDNTEDNYRTILSTKNLMVANAKNMTEKWNDFVLIIDSLKSQLCQSDEAFPNNLMTAVNQIKISCVNLPHEILENITPKLEEIRNNKENFLSLLKLLQEEFLFIMNDTRSLLKEESQKIFMKIDSTDMKIEDMLTNGEVLYPKLNEFTNTPQKIEERLNNLRNDIQKQNEQLMKEYSRQIIETISSKIQEMSHLNDQRFSLMNLISEKIDNCTEILKCLPTVFSHYFEKAFEMMSIKNQDEKRTLSAKKSDEAAIIENCATSQSISTSTSKNEEFTSIISENSLKVNKEILKKRGKQLSSTDSESEGIIREIKALFKEQKISIIDAINDQLSVIRSNSSGVDIESNLNLSLETDSSLLKSIEKKRGIKNYFSHENTDPKKKKNEFKNQTNTNTVEVNLHKDKNNELKKSIKGPGFKVENFVSSNTKNVGSENNSLAYKSKSAAKILSINKKSSRFKENENENIKENSFDDKEQSCNSKKNKSDKEKSRTKKRKRLISSTDDDSEIDNDETHLHRELPKETLNIKEKNKRKEFSKFHNDEKNKIKNKKVSKKMFSNEKYSSKYYKNSYTNDTNASLSSSDSEDVFWDSRLEHVNEANRNDNPNISEALSTSLRNCANDAEFSEAVLSSYDDEKDSDLLLKQCETINQSISSDKSNNRYLNKNDTCYPEEDSETSEGKNLKITEKKTIAERDNSKIKTRSKKDVSTVRGTSSKSFCKSRTSATQKSKRNLFNKTELLISSGNESNCEEDDINEETKTHLKVNRSSIFSNKTQKVEEDSSASEENPPKNVAGNKSDTFETLKENEKLDENEALKGMNAKRKMSSKKQQGERNDDNLLKVIKPKEGTLQNTTVDYDEENFQGGYKFPSCAKSNYSEIQDGNTNLKKCQPTNEQRNSSSSNLPVELNSSIIDNDHVIEKNIASQKKNNRTSMQVKTPENPVSENITSKASKSTTFSIEIPSNPIATTPDSKKRPTAKNLCLKRKLELEVSEKCNDQDLKCSTSHVFPDDKKIKTADNHTSSKSFEPMRSHDQTNDLCSKKSPNAVSKALEFFSTLDSFTSDVQIISPTADNLSSTSNQIGVMKYSTGVKEQTNREKNFELGIIKCTKTLPSKNCNENSSPIEIIKETKFVKSFNREVNSKQLPSLQSKSNKQLSKFLTYESPRGSIEAVSQNRDEPFSITGDKRNFFPNSPKALFCNYFPNSKGYDVVTLD